MSPGEVMARLAEIENDLAERQNRYEAAAEDFTKLKRTWELRLAQGFVSQPSNLTATERKANALLAVAVAKDSLYEDFAAAEARYEGLRGVINVLQSRATVGQSLLKAMTREFSTA